MAPLQYQQAQFQADSFKWPVFSTALMGGRDPSSAAGPPALPQPPPNPMDSLAEASASRKRSLDAAAGGAGPEPNGRPDAQSGGETPDAKRARAVN